MIKRIIKLRGHHFRNIFPISGKKLNRFFLHRIPSDPRSSKVVEIIFSLNRDYEKKESEILIQVIDGLDDICDVCDIRNFGCADGVDDMSIIEKDLGLEVGKTYTPQRIYEAIEYYKTEKI